MLDGEPDYDTTPIKTASRKVNKGQAFLDKLEKCVTEVVGLLSYMGDTMSSLKDSGLRDAFMENFPVGSDEEEKDTVVIDR